MEALEVNLTELFYGKFEPPEAIRTITHKVGLTGGARYQPSKKIDKSSLPPEQRLPKSAKQILSFVKCQTKPVSAAETEKRTPWTRNHCNIILCSLWKEGLLSRYKMKGDGTSWYMYSYKPKAND